MHRMNIIDVREWNTIESWIYVLDDWFYQYEQSVIFNPFYHIRQKLGFRNFLEIENKIVRPYFISKALTLNIWIVK